MKLSMASTFRFDEPGTLARPGPIGRLVRFAFGVLMGLVAWQTLSHSEVTDLRRVDSWFWLLLAFLLAPYVFNIGFGIKAAAWPRIAAIAGVLGGGLLGYVQHGTVLTRPLWMTTTVVTVYVFGHLGLSFLLSAMLGTPGCEMRAVPHLIGLVRGNSAREHYCPGFIDGLDRWESERNRPESERTVSQAPPNDLTGRWGGLLLVYGIPWLAVQLVGNLISSTPAVAATWTLAFAIMGLACIFNALRCSRVHCWFVGPWFLLAAILTVLRYFGYVGLSWSTILNAGWLGAVLLYMITENVWGKYFSPRVSPRA